MVYFVDLNYEHGTASRFYLVLWYFSWYSIVRYVFRTVKTLAQTQDNQHKGIYCIRKLFVSFRWILLNDSPASTLLPLFESYSQFISGWCTAWVGEKEKGRFGRERRYRHTQKHKEMKRGNEKSKCSKCERWHEMENECVW